jgi:hypothetical protein
MKPTSAIPAMRTWCINVVAASVLIGAWVSFAEIGRAHV